MTAHRCPPGDYALSSVMPCCGRTPLEVVGERMAFDDALVTCRGAMQADARAVTPEPRVITADPGVQPEQEPAPTLKVDKAIAELRRFEEIDRAAVARGESPNWWERGAEQRCPHGHERGDHHWFECMGVSPFAGDALAADGYLPLRGTATGDNQLDVPQPVDEVKATQRAMLDEIADLLDVGAYDDLIEELKRRLAPAEPHQGALVLPRLPEGAVALVAVADGLRYELDPNGSFYRADRRDPYSLIDVLAEAGPDGAVPVFAAPDKPRVWPKLEPVGAAVTKVEVDGHGIWERGGLHGWRQGGESRTFLQLLLVGEVREILDSNGGTE